VHTNSVLLSTFPSVFDGCRNNLISYQTGIFALNLALFLHRLGLASRLRDPCTFMLRSAAEPHHFYTAPVTAPAPCENFDAAPVVPAPAPTLVYSKAKFSKRTKVYTHVETILFI
jgi:hypothetical protein